MNPHPSSGMYRIVRACRGLVVASLLTSLAWSATASRQMEYQVKAAYLLNFAKFVDWPPPPLGQGEVFRLGVVGDETTFAIISEVLRGKKVGENPIEVVLLQPQDDASSCRVIFIPRTVNVSASDLRNARPSTLFVGERDGFAASGGHIGFVPRGDNLRYQVNLHTAKAAGLRLSSTLASLAEIVDSGPR